MARRRGSAPSWKLGYSTNVHPGETLAQVHDFLARHTSPIKRRLFGDEPAGLELRLGIGTARELRAAAARHRLRGAIEDAGLELFSINAYPLRDFHARRVKDDVYRPSWARVERARWTSTIARAVARLVPPGREVSISTLGGGFRRDGHDHRTLRRMARNYLTTLETLRELEEEGFPFLLAAEPEPETTFETVEDVIRFLEDHLLPVAREAWRGRKTRRRIEEDVRRLFTVNLDTCHLSTLFEDPVRSIRRLASAGVRLGKLHATSCVALRRPRRAPAGWRDLRGMHEPRYLHQFCGVDGEGRVTWRGLDLDELPRSLRAGRHPDVEEIRSHFHVPLYLKRFRRLETTREDTARAVREIRRSRATRHIVIETYTWPIIARGDGAEDRLRRGIAAEFRWLLEVLGTAR